MNFDLYEKYDIDTLKKDIESILCLYYGGKVINETTGQIKFYSLLKEEKTPSAVFTPTKLQYKDFSTAEGKDTSGNIITLAKLIEKDGHLHINAYVKKNYKDKASKEYKENQKEIFKKRVEEHYKERGINKELIKDWYIDEYTTKNNKENLRCNIITYTEEGKTDFQRIVRNPDQSNIKEKKGFQRWNYEGKAEPYLFIPQEWEHYKGKNLFICEGVPDALTLLQCGYNAISFRSKEINKTGKKELLNFIKEINPEKLIVIPDKDNFSNWKKKFKKRFKKSIILDITEYDKDLIYKDINDYYLNILNKDIKKFNERTENLIKNYKDDDNTDDKVIDIDKILKENNIEYYCSMQYDYYKVNNRLKTITILSKENFKDALRIDLKNLLYKRNVILDKDELKKIVENYREKISFTQNQIAGVTIHKSDKRIIVREKENSRRYLNLFSGFSIKYEENKKTYKEDIKHNHIYKVMKALLKNNQEHIDYLCEFFAYNLFNNDDNKRLGKIIVLHSEENGIGKGSLMKFFETILKDHFVTVQKTELKGDFNSYLEKALVCLYDEVELTRDMYDSKIKTYVTADKIRINEKGVKQYDKVNNTMFVVTTNNRDSASITKHDRRAIMFDCGTELYYKNHMEFWLEYYQNLEQNSKQFLEFLKTLYDESNKKEMYMKLERGIITDYKEEVIKMNLNSIESFLIDIENDYEYNNLLNEHIEKKLDEYYITTMQLYQLYKKYCEDNGRRPKSNRKFLNSFNIEYRNKYKNECYTRKHMRMGEENKPTTVVEVTEFIKEIENKVTDENIEEKEKKCLEAYFSGKIEEANKLRDTIEIYYEDNIKNPSEAYKKINKLNEKIRSIKTKKAM